MSASRTRLANAAHQAMLQRSELQRSLGISRSEFKPGALTERGKFHAITAAQDASAIVQQELSTHRLLVGAAAVGGAAWMLRDPIREKAPGLLTRAVDAVKNFAATINYAIDPSLKEDELPSPKTATEKAKAKIHQAQAASLSTAKYFQDELETKMKPLAETARETRDRAADLAERTAESARQTAEAAKARVQDGYGRARAATSDLAAKGREQAEVAKNAAGSAYEKGKEKAHVASSRVKEFAAEQPLTLLAGALAAGLLVGSLVSKKDEIK